MVVKLVSKKTPPKKGGWYKTPEMERIYQGALEIIARHKNKGVHHGDERSIQQESEDTIHQSALAQCQGTKGPRKLGRRKAK